MATAVLVYLASLYIENAWINYHEVDDWRKIGVLSGLIGGKCGPPSLVFPNNPASH